MKQNWNNIDHTQLLMCTTLRFQCTYVRNWVSFIKTANINAINISQSQLRVNTKTSCFCLLPVYLHIYKHILLMVQLCVKWRENIHWVSTQFFLWNVSFHWLSCLELSHISMGTGFSACRTQNRDRRSTWLNNSDQDGGIWTPDKWLWPMELSESSTHASMYYV